MSEPVSAAVPGIRACVASSEPNAMKFFAGTASGSTGLSHVHSQSTAFCAFWGSGRGRPDSNGAPPHPSSAMNRMSSSAPPAANDAGNRIDFEMGNGWTLNGFCDMAEPPRAAS